MVVVALLLSLSACATGAILAAQDSEEQQLTDLRVMDLTDKTEIVLHGERPFKYTFLSLESPPRIVVNILSMNRGSISKTMNVSKGTVQGITLHEGRNPHRSVRVEIALNQYVKPDIRLEGSSLFVSLPKSRMNDASQVVNEYRIGPEDVLEIMVWKNADLTRSVTVRPDGKVSLPLVGDIQASGLTTEELKKIITERMKDYIATPEVSILVTSINSYFFYIIGEVVKPGKYPLKERTTMLQAVSMAGGFTPFASRNSISVFRKDPSSSRETKIRIRYDDIVSSDDSGKNVLIQSGDTILIP